MSVSGVSTGHHPEPAWAASKSLAELGSLLSEVQIHVASYHGRGPCSGKLLDLIAALMLAFLRGGQDPQLWRPYIVDDLIAAPYVKGCCAWRD